MELSARELWTIIHGMGFGAVFLLSFAGGLAGLYSLRPEFLTTAGLRERMLRLKFGMWVMALVSWATVITGTFIVYPWYRATPPGSVASLPGGITNPVNLADYPRYLLLANPSTAEWHTFGMEWKEHVGWLAPIAATVVAFAVTYYGAALAKRIGERNALIAFFILAFVTAGVAGAFGAFINKVAPVR